MWKVWLLPAGSVNSAPQAWEESSLGVSRYPPPNNEIGGTCFCWYSKIFVDVMFIAQKVYIYIYIVYTVTIDISHCHPQNYKSYLMDSFTYSIIPHPRCITLDSFPDLSKKIRVQDPLLPKLGFLIFRTPGTVGICQHLVWGLPKKPWKKHWEIISTILLGGPLLTFMIHREPVFWQDPKNYREITAIFSTSAGERTVWSKQQRSVSDEFVSRWLHER